jgi:antitoxin MazE
VPPMKTRLVNMGNSRGVRLPKPLIEQVGILDEVELLVRNGQIVIAPVRAPRDGWASAAATIAADAPKLDETEPTHFDETEWTW